MSRYPSWPTTNQGNIVGTRLANELYHRFIGGLNALSLTDQKDAALAELLATTPEVFNVKSFGAKGDGDGTGGGTDDIVAIRDTIAAAGTTGIVVFSGAHRISDSVIIGSNANLDFTNGHLEPDGDFIPLIIVSQTFIRCNRNRAIIQVPSAVTHTSVGLEIRAKIFTDGTLHVAGAGSHGIFMEQRVAGNNLNFSQASFYASACGGDGFRMEITAASGSNMNAMDLAVQVFDCNVGARLISGIGNFIRLTTDACANEGLIVPSGAAVANAMIVYYDDGSNGAETDLTAGSGQIFGFFGKGIPNKAATGWILWDRESVQVRDGGGGPFRYALRLRNPSANDSSESVDIRFEIENSVAATTIRARGDKALQFRDHTKFAIFDKAPVAQAAAYTRNATIVEDRTLLASASATAENNNNVLAAIIADLQGYGFFQ